MSRISLVRTNQPIPNESELGAVRSFLFGVVDGAGKDDRSRWQKFWSKVKRLEAGEVFDFEIVFPRNSKFHRKFFALLQVGFESWDPGRKHKTHKGIPVTKNFEQFREDVTILAGFYEQTFDLSGQMKLKAKSIKFSKMDDAEFEQVYSAVADVLLTHVLTRYANRADLDRVVEQVMRFV